MSQSKLTWLKYVSWVMDRTDGKKITKPYTRGSRTTNKDHCYTTPKTNQKRNARHDKKPKVQEQTKEPKTVPTATKPGALVSEHTPKMVPTATKPGAHVIVDSQIPQNGDHRS